MNITELIASLDQSQIRLYLDGERLRFTSAHPLTEQDLSAIRTHRDALVAHLRKEIPEEDHTFPGSPYPLSRGQQALWFLYDLDRSSLAYNTVYATRLQGPVNPGILEKALGLLTHKHPLLRVQFSNTSGQPTQTILADAPPVFTQLDAPDSSTIAVQEQTAALVDQPFVLEQGPPVRWVLLTHTDGTPPVLVLSAHHLLVDFRSLELLFRDLEIFYHQLVSGNLPEWHRSPWTYRSYVNWSENWLSTRPGQEARKYWLQQLSGALPVLELPTDFQRPTHQDYSGETLVTTLSPDLAVKVRETARAQALTPNMVLLGAFGALLHRYSGQNEILLGVPMWGRNRSEWEEIVGYFVNPVVLRLKFTDETDGQSLFVQSRTLTMDALVHQQYPFPVLVEELAAQRDPSRSPVFQVAFVYEGESKGKNKRSGWYGETVLGGQRGAVFDLTLTALEQEGSFRLTWEYATALFRKETISRLAQHFEALLAALLTAPEKPVAQLPLFSQNLHDAWFALSSVSAPYPENKTLLDLIEAQVRKTPDAIAVETGDTALTYRQLWERSSHLAARLCDAGAGPNLPIGFAFSRSPELMLAVLAIWKTGAACLPVDTSLPEERLRYLLQTSQARFILTSRALAANLPQDEVPIVLLEQESSASAAAQTWEKSPASAEDLLYVIFTSGSTGRPKGVAMPHRPLVNLVAWQTAQPIFAAPARVLQYSPASFDVFFQELGSTWSSGGTLILLDEDTRRDSQALWRWIQKSRVERLFLPVVALQHLAENASNGNFPTTLRDIIVAGEALRITPAIRDFFAATQCRLHNHYGPSETHVVTAYTLSGDPQSWDILPPIGTPIANTNVFLLDARGSSVPLGAQGEIFIGGVPLAHGYLNRPELTQLAFIAHPDFGRLYRTGDLARWRFDGTLEYQGRTDHQIKLRGFRIELGEIEAVLGQHPSVSEAAVIVFGEDGARRLVGHVAVGGGKEADAPAIKQELEEHLRAFLPDYMRPSVLMIQAALPKTPSGKLDRLALPHPLFEELIRSQAPQTETERLLVGLWSKLLGTSEVGTETSFFALGGHSLLGMQLIASLRTQFGVELPLRTLFDSPTISRLAAQIETATGALTLPLLSPAVISGNPPLSFGQQRLWLLDHIDGPSALYNLPATLQLHGPLQLEAFRLSLKRLVLRHASLRVAFPSENGEPLLLDLAPYDPLTLTDLRQVPADLREKEAQQLAAQHGNRPFDLSRGPLFALELLILQDETFWLLFNVHHSVADGWSLGVLLQELGSLYDAELSFQPAALPELSVQYVDFAVWQRNWLQGDVLQSQLSFWKQQLTGAPPLLELPLDRPRPAVASYRGGLFEQTLDSGLVEKLAEFNLNHGSTTFITLLGVLKVLLWRYSGQNDLSVGIPVANRRDEQLKNLVGFFVNTLVLRSQLDGTDSFATTLASLRKTVLDALAHQDLPFELLVEKLQPERSFSHHPFFQVMFVEQNTHVEDLQLHELQIEPLAPPVAVSKFDLTLYSEQTDSALTLRWEYSTDLFDAERIVRAAGHFEHLLRDLVQQPAKPISQLKLLTPPEIQSLQLWGRGPETPVKWHNVVEAFEHQARQSPEAIAVRCGITSLTYSLLEQRANQLAHFLCARGVGPGKTVALCLPRDSQVIVAVLGVLKTGAAYLPLDPSYPAARLAFIVEDSETTLLLTHSELNIVWPESVQSLCDLDKEQTAISQYPVAPLGIVIRNNPEALVYIIYTSGSTGTPKGAAVYHHSFANLLQWYGKTLELSAQDSVLLISALGFDLTQKNLFAPLLAGGILCFPESEIYDSRHLLADIQNHSITWLNGTPSAFYPLLEDDLQTGWKHLRSLRWVVLGGEPIQRERLTPWLHSSPCQAKILNSYGPTECTDVCVAWAFDGKQTEPIPLGTPIDNTQLAVVDPAGQPVPVGVPGELWIGGVCLGHGYLRQPELNASKFVHLDTLGPPVPMYRSGDRVRWLCNGVLDYLGRADHQVKLRGFRIELGEVEAALHDLSGVSAAVATIHGEGDRQKLVGYVVSENAALAGTYRTELANRLPAFMIPAQIITLEQLPLTPNGKVDRLRLPGPENLSPELATPLSSPTEQQLAALWSEFLGVKTVNPDSDFFALGGHSLLAMRLAARIRDQFQMELSPRAVFENSTLRALAGRVDHERQTPQNTLAPLPEGTTRTLSFAQKRLWFLDQLEGGSSSYHIPAVLELKGDLDIAALHKTWATLVERHESLRVCFPTLEGEAFVQTVSLADPLHDADLTGHSEPESEAAKLRDAFIHAPFDLSKGPLFRLQLLKLAPQRFWLLFNMHHIVSDGWSIDLLIREQAALYQAFRSGQPSSLAPAPLDYTAYAAWQQSQSQTPYWTTQLQYWLNQLADAPERLELPTDFPRPSVQQHRGGEVCFELPCPLADSLQSLAQTCDGTFFMVLVAAFNVLLHRFSGQRDICLGTPVANRPYDSLSGIVGLFLNTVVLRSQVPVGASFRGLMEGVRRTTLEALAHQEVPFETLVEHLQPNRNLNHHPLFQVFINLANTREETTRLEGLDIDTLSVTEEHASKFDLSLSLTKTASKTWSGRFEYDASLFSEETIRFLSECYLTLLERVVLSPDVPLADLSVLGARFTQRVSASPKLRPTALPSGFGTIEQSIPERFSAQVAQFPDHVAVLTPTQRLTYSELDHAARTVAAALQTLPETPRIGVLCPHDSSMIVGLLGVLMTGRAYIPLDPAQPANRLSYILEDTEVSIIVASKSLRPLAETLAGTSRTVVELEALTHAPLQELPKVSPDAVAYVLYTSGSTGRPKGVVQTHRNVLHFMREYTQNLAIRPEDRLIQVASYAFDAGVMDIFGALFNGATLCPVDLRKMTPQEAFEWMDDSKISILHVTPTVYRLLVSSLGEDTHSRVAAIRLVVLGGEPVLRGDFEAFRKHFRRDCFFVNGLGPTESTVTLQHFLDGSGTVSRPSVPVGYPVGGTEIFLCHEDGEKSELFGEIVIRSAHVALGYWGQQSPSFQDDPLQPEQRLYRTGDLGRLLPDGTLESLGRRDGQIKLRGFRIELGEIEAVLRQFAGVAEVAVALVQNEKVPGAEPKLCAYVRGEFKLEELQAYTRKNLPDYMNPAALVPMATFPMTVNGKLDRKALPIPAFTEETASSALVGTESERLLSTLWADILRGGPYAPEAHFFQVGGHSLLATRLLSKIRQSFEVELPLVALFEHPVLRDQARVVDTTRRGSALAPITPAKSAPTDSQTLPLSASQERLWLLAQLEPEVSSVYNITATLKLDGVLQVSALRTALLQLTERQLSLRMNFRQLDGTPHVILRPAYDPLIVESYPAEFSNEELLRRAVDHARTPFQLESELLFRLTLLEFGSGKSALLFNIHHLICDGWSLGVLLKELNALYLAALKNKEAQLPALPISVLDYAVWQKHQLATASLAPELAFWKKQLRDAPALCSIPSDFPRPAVKSNRGSQMFRRLPSELLNRLETVSRQQGVTLFMTLLAGFKVVLSRYTREQDIVVASPVANRTRSEIEPLIGFFVNTLVLRTNLSGDPTFAELLHRIRKTALDAYSHQELPFEKLVEELHPVRSRNHNPLAQVFFVLQTALPETSELGGLPFETLDFDRGTSKFDLSFSLRTCPTGADCVLEYDTDLYRSETIARLFHHFEILLETASAHPNQPLRTLSILSPLEQNQLLQQGSGPTTSAPLSGSVAEFFHERALANPDAIAVVSGQTSLTYAELDARSTALAQRLIQQGVTLEQPVGLFLDRSPEMIVGLLAILKAGAAYVALAPDWPDNRLNLLLEEADIRLLVTTTALATRFASSELDIVRLDHHWTSAEIPKPLPLPLVQPHHAAYLTFTSGSTGRPKGVIVPHRGVLRLVFDTQNIPVSQQDRVLQFAPLAFDASTLEIWGALLHGASLVLHPPHTPALHELGTFIRTQGITFAWLTAGLFHALVEDSLDLLQGLQHLFVGGDVLSVSAVKKAVETLQNTRIVNGYGPTENTTFTTVHEVKATQPLKNSVPIGRPILNTQVYLLDPHLQLVPVGVPGELYTGGDGLALGYIGQPRLTEERFIQHPKFGRLYSTGDLCVWNPAGEIEFLRRLDNQIKLRGYRIELGEIETVLQQATGGAEAVVVVAGQGEQKQLVAFVKTLPDSAWDLAVLHQTVRRILPDYMVPARIEPLAQFPLNANGKVDRVQLAQSAANYAQTQPASATPAEPTDWTLTEQALATFWRDLLQIDSLERDADFFSLGGHSLMAMRLISRVQKAFQINLPLAAVFESPMLSKLAATIDAAPRNSALPALLPSPKDQPIPPSFAQKRLWFLAQLQTEAPHVYHIGAGFLVNGTLLETPLRSALRKLTARQQSLRMTFEAHDGEPFVQLLEPYDPLVVLPHPHPEDESGVADAFFREPFDLKSGPLLRLRYLQKPDGTGILFFCVHHIVADGFSLAILVEELQQLYTEACGTTTSSEATLSPTPVEYSDYAVWQQDWLQSEVLRNELGFWKNALANAPVVLDLATDHPRPSVKTYRGAQHTSLLGSKLLNDLEQLSRKHDATLFMTLLSAFNVLLWRYSGQSDLLVGTPVANRTETATETLVGFFVNTLVLRTRLDDAETFTDLLAQVRAHALAAYDHQQIPFELLVGELQPERSLSHSPLFQVMLALQNIALPNLELEGTTLTPLNRAQDTSKFDLLLNFSAQNNGLIAVWEYSTDLFEPATIERMSHHLLTLLQEIVAHPNDSLKSLSLLSPLEQNQLLQQGSGPTTPAPLRGNVAEFFIQRLQSNPAAIAAVSGTSSLTYAELDTRSTALAQHLLQRGVKLEQPVGLFLDRSLEMIVGLLAILKAGGAYVALAPDWPVARLHLLLEEADIRLIVTTTSFASRLSSKKLDYVLLDHDRPSAENPEPLPLPLVQPHHAAYLTFTSGSTGRPKGVIVPHQGVLRLVFDTQNIPISAQDRVLQFAPLAFDASTLEIWGALLNGASLVLHPPHTPSLQELGTFIQSQGITFAWLTAGLFHALVEDSLESLQGLHHLFIGGDVLSVPAVKKAVKALRNTRIVNGYGPTENTTFTTVHEVKATQPLKNSVPIGRPILNTQVYLLDPHLQLVPVGVPGELYTGGDGLALGYIGQPQLTEERFIQHPKFGRLYRTGDLCVWNPAGEIEFQRRLDNQIKLRGYRIELGEIESVLQQATGGAESVVVLSGQGEQKQLFAFVKPLPQIAVDLAGLYQTVRRLLPDYMVPARIEPLAQFPLNANGKVDRVHLAQSAASFAQTQPASDTPAEPSNWTPTEQALAKLWRDLLQIDFLEQDAHFFSLGGHSLMAMRLISRVQSELGVKLPIESIFTAPTIHEMAARIDAQKQDAARHIPHLPRDGTLLPLSFAQERLWFLNQLEPENPFYNTPVALRLEGNLQKDALFGALEDLVLRHEVLRTAFRNDKGQPRQFPLGKVQVPVFEKDISHLPDSERAATLLELALQESATPFLDLSTPPLLRVTLIALGHEDYALLITMHHIVTDGWSLNVLTRDLSHFYRLRSGTHPKPLPTLSIQYADFAAWQRETLRGEILETQLQYWRSHLRGAPPMLSLPTDHARPALQQFRGKTHRFDVSRPTRDALNALALEENATLFMALLSGFAVVLSRHSGQQDLVIGSPIANRQHSDLSELLGFFVNTLALRLDLSDQPTFRDLLRRTRRVALDAYAHQDLPFERLVDDLQPERNLSRSPLFQVMFALQNMTLDAVDLQELKISPIQVPRVAALFDMVLDFWDTPAGLHGVLDYDCALFEAASAQRMMRHLEIALESFAENPDRPIQEITLVDAQERAKVLALANGPAVNHPVHQSFATAFEAQVASTPTRIAAWDAGKTADYAELNRRANQVANLLRFAGFPPNQAVGVMLPRGLDYLSAILGVIKAGGFFLPLDPGYPESRLRYMLENSGCAWLLTTASAFQSVLGKGAPSSLQSVLLFEGHVLSEKLAPALQIFDTASLLTQSTENPLVANTATDILYLLYTSGSTGHPKGAMVRHDGALNHIYAEARLLELNHHTAFLQSAPSSSDISVWQCLAPLVLGGRVVFADFDTVCTPTALFALIRNTEVTLIELVPVVLESLLTYAEQQTPDERSLSALRRAMVTGETVSAALVNRWFSVWPNIPLVNAYGPTEAADDVCQHEMHGPLAAGEFLVPLGRPIDNLSVLVLENRQSLAPVGVPGEICVGGIGVGAGYWQQPERTAAAFFSNPFVSETFGETLYGTGDLGRWRDDGVLEFLGRLDQQVQIRGCRVELGEIEAALAQHPAVRQVLVFDQQTGNEDRQLVAYVQVNADAASHSELADEQVELWRDLHQESYRDTSALEKCATFNDIGWDSNYTGQPLPRVEMEECVSNAVSRILELRPIHLLEIGCGTGLLLYPLAPHCRRYLGTDFSAVAISQLEKNRNTLSLAGLERTELQVRSAHDFSGLTRGEFNVIALNSVVQYFPTEIYLSTVLQQAADHAAPNGAVFVGDVRNLHHLRFFHLSVQTFRAAESLTARELSRRIDEATRKELELAVAPAFFENLSLHHRIAAVTLRPKRGWCGNEMTRFRFDAVLHLDNPPGVLAPADAPFWQDASQGAVNLEKITQHLQQNQPLCWGLRRVPNARVAEECFIEQWLKTAAPTATVQQLRQALETQPLAGMEPEALWTLVESLPYRVEIAIEPDSESGELAVLFVHRDGPEYFLGLHSLTSGFPIATTESLTNNPLHEKVGRALGPELREFLKTRLPGHMIPAAFLILDRFPLLPNGKIDRYALPNPSADHTGLGDFVAPRTPTEHAVCAVWQKVLVVENPSVHSNFFALGGHSLKAAQVLSLLQQHGKTILLRDIFSYPTVAELSAHLDRQKDQETVAPIPTTPTAEHYPATHAQERLWLITQMDGSAAYHMADARVLRGPLDRAALRQAFQSLIQRHETLRTSFFEWDGALRQKVAPELPFELPIRDLRSSPNPISEARSLALQDAAADFNLDEAPLLRAQLLTLGSEEHVLLFNVHHIICDGWSMDVLISELMSLYHSASICEPSPLPALVVQHRDYVHWHRTRLEANQVSHLDFWKHTLADLPPPLSLPLDFSRPPRKGFRGSRQTLRLSPEKLQGLQALAQTENLTLFVLLTALTQVLLHRYSREHDICLGCPVSGREHPDLERQIGFFINTLVIRQRINRELSFRQFLRETRETVLAALEHQEYPFDLLVRELNPARDASRNPFFDVMLVLQNTANIALELPDLELSSLELDYGTSQFDLLWNFAETAGGLHLALQYDSDLFSRETISQTLSHWENLVDSVLETPEAALGSLSILSIEERAALLKAQPKAMPASVYPSLVAWFEAQAEKTPDAIALTDGARQLSYGKLNHQANHLAHKIRAHLRLTVSSTERLVGLSLPRSAELIVGLLAILKAGAAYVPLDADAPAERLRFILQDSKVSLLVTQPGVLPLPEAELPPLFTVDFNAETSPITENNLHTPITPETPAYVIYTSGSTGQPKGAIITHGNVVRLFESTNHWFHFGPADVWTLFHSFAFDFSVWEIWGALLVGGRLVIVPYLISRSPEQFYELLCQEKVTVLNQTPSAFRQLSQAEEVLGQSESLALRTVIFGGEALDPRQLKPWFERHGDTQPQLVNMYGITETTVHVTYRALRKTDALDAASMIGEPIPDLSLLILDESFQPVPVGVPGELFVGGAGLAAGYLFREELTRQRFLPDPFHEGNRLYRTGDCVRRRRDGELEYLGRLDEQLKIRGFRIELGEIRSVLLRHEGIRDATVISRPFEGDTEIFAYYVPTAESLSEADLRHHMHQFVPTYMVPLQFHELQALPLNINGKIDHRALPEPRKWKVSPAESSAVNNAPIPDTPSSQQETVVLQLWRDVLSNNDLSASANVFEHGAHSVLVLRVRALLQERLQRPIPAVLFFQYPSVAAFTAALILDASDSQPRFPTPPAPRLQSETAHLRQQAGKQNAARRRSARKNEEL
jgi:amino acid adenylation domain-containing protein